MLLAAAAAVAALAPGGASTAGARVPHGGAGAVNPTGAVGTLRLDRSTGADVQRFGGAADYLGIGVFRSGGFAPRFLAIGYDCRRMRDGGIPTALDDGTNTRHPRLSGIDCVTVYFVNERTNRLALFTSRSRHFATPAGSRPGMRWSKVKEHGHQYVNCDGLFMSGRHALLVLWNVGGREPPGDPRPPIRGGRVSEIGLASTRHPLGVECPEW